MDATRQSAYSKDVEIDVFEYAYNFDNVKNNCVEQPSLPFTQKLQRRKAALERTSTLSENEKISLAPCLVPEVISSDESDDAEEAKFITKPLPWRSAKVDKLFESLDRKSQRYRSKRSRLMDFNRAVGEASDRSQPPFLEDWICKN